jgi:site-specific DNA-cytosine methylase
MQMEKHLTQSFLTYKMLDIKYITTYLMRSLLYHKRENEFTLLGSRNDLLEHVAADGADDFDFPTLPILNRGFQDIAEKDLDQDTLSNLTLSNHQLSTVRNQSYTKRYSGARFLSDFALPTKTIQSSYASYIFGSQFVSVNKAHDISSTDDNDDIDDDDDHNNDNDDDDDDTATRWRKFKPREAARLQGFPESFKLCKSRPYHLLGNAVVPSMLCFIM